MKISKLFHWLYAILMLLPFGLVLFNMLHGLFSPNVSLLSWSDFLAMIDDLSGDFLAFDFGASSSVSSVYNYLIYEVFGFGSTLIVENIITLLTYWTCISIIWLVFDVFMYVPLLVHRWIDKAKLE